MAPLEEAPSGLSSHSSSGFGEKVGLRLCFGGDWLQQVCTTLTASLTITACPYKTLLDLSQETGNERKGHVKEPRELSRVVQRLGRACEAFCLLVKIGHALNRAAKIWDSGCSH